MFYEKIRLDSAIRTVLVPAARTSAKFLKAPRDSSRLLRGGEKISRRREIFRGFGGRSRIWGSYPRYLARNLASSSTMYAGINSPAPFDEGSFPSNVESMNLKVICLGFSYDLRIFFTCWVDLLIEYTQL